MARTKSMTRADMIAALKSRGQKGKLSKMTKSQLTALLEKTAPPGDKPGADEKRPKGDVELEPDDQDGGHFYRKDGTTRSDGKHEHEKNPWPTEKSKAPAPAPKPKARKKKLDPIEDPDADITVDLVNRRLNADRHPATGRKISGKKASEMQYILMGNSMTRIMDGDRVAKDDIEQRLENIDKLHKQEFPSTKSKGADVDVANVIDEHSKRTRSKPDRLSEQQPDAFADERDEEDGQRGEGAGHSYRSWMKQNLKQYGGNMSKAAAAYKQRGAGRDDDLGPEPEPEPLAEPTRSTKRRGSMTLQDALKEGLISKANFDKYMDKYLKETFGVSSDKELAELKRQHRAARQQDGGHYARGDGTVSDKEKTKYSGHTHRPARNPTKGDSSDEESAPASPDRRITRGMDPREARRERRNQGGRGRGEQEGEGLFDGSWDSLKTGFIYDSDVLAHGVESVGHSLASSSFGRAVGSAYNSYEGFMDKHKVIHDIVDDAALGLGVAGLTLATGGLGDAAVLGAEGTGATVEAEATETAADEGASKAASAAEKDASKAASAAEKDASKAGDDGGDLGPQPEPEALPGGGRQSFALNPASVGDAGATAEANAGKDGVMSSEAESANKKASDALKDAGNKIGDRVKQEASDALKDAGNKIGDRVKQEANTQVSSLREKLKVMGKTAGLAVVGQRGEELTKDADEDEHADDDPGGGKGTGSKPPPGYFANQFTDDIFAANSRALHHDGPSRAFGDPWYS
jgi:hypothetical protein